MGLPWWRKVHAHVAAGEITYVGLAERTGQSERTLRRWINRPETADPRHGPAGELFFLQRIARALGWPVWYLVDDAYGYPPPEPFLRLGKAVEQLPASRRLWILQMLSAEVADGLIEIAERYGSLHEAMERRWGIPPDAAPPAVDSSPGPGGGPGRE